MAINPPSLCMFLCAATIAFFSTARSQSLSDTSYAERGILIDLSLNWDGGLFSDTYNWDTSGDPCASFKLVTCNSQNQVISIDLTGLGVLGTISEAIGDLSYLKILALSNNKFYGQLPSNLSKLTGLTTLDLSHNSFIGTIPDSLSQLSNLSEATSLNLAYNNLSGPIPASLSAKFCYDQFQGNPAVQNLTAEENATFPPCRVVYVAPPSSGGTNVGAIIGGVVGGSVLLLLIVAGILLYCLFYGGDSKSNRFKRLSQEEIDEIEANIAGTSLARVKRYTLSELMDATNSFSEKEKVGEGGYAGVYKGTLPDGKIVAIKRMKEYNVGKSEMLAFLNELDTISRAVHRNVIKLEGYCIQDGERILVFPYLPNGSVQDHFKGFPLCKPPLSLDLRKKIALAAARGISYLHDDGEMRIVHRDIKAANVLLDEKFNAVVADFGLAKLISNEDTHVTTAVRGTYGHIAPEYIMTGQTTDKSDVYSFGVFLLEMITGKSATLLTQASEAENGLRAWCTTNFREGRLTEMIDIELRYIDIDVLEGEYKTETLEDLVQVAILCLAEDPKSRPSMADVIGLLQGNGLEAAWALWEKTETEMSADSAYEYNFDVGTPGRGNASYSNPSGTQNSLDVSVVGFNLSGPR